MTSTGPGHIHPFGEFDLCFNVDGDSVLMDLKKGGLSILQHLGMFQL